MISDLDKSLFGIPKDVGPPSARLYDHLLQTTMRYFDTG